MQAPLAKPESGDLAFPPPVGSKGLSERLASLLLKP
jgi:hypothetical protein